MKWKLMHRPLRLKVLDIDPKPLEIDGETYYLVKHNHGVSFLRTDASEIKQSRIKDDAF